MYLPRGSYVVPFCGFGWETISFWFEDFEGSRTGFQTLKKLQYIINKIKESHEYKIRKISKYKK